MFSDRLKSYRSSLNMTQMEFSKATGIARGIIGQLESNTRPPSKNILVTLSNYSKKSIDWWYERDDEEKKWEDSNALNVLLDYMIEQELINEKGEMNEKSKNFIWQIVEAEIKKKLKKKSERKV